MYKEHFDKINENILTMNMNDLVIILGDYNCPHINWTFQNGTMTPVIRNNVSANDYILQSMSLNNLKQHNSIVNMHDSLLDLVLSNFEHKAITVAKSDFALVNEDAYHPTLDIQIETNTSRLDTINHRNFNFRKANFELINRDLEATDWSHITSSTIEDAISFFYRVINDMFPTLGFKVNFQSGMMRI